MIEVIARMHKSYRHIKNSVLWNWYHEKSQHQHSKFDIKHKKATKLKFFAALILVVEFICTLFFYFKIKQV